MEAKRWVVTGTYGLESPEVLALSKALHIMPVTAALLCNRGYHDASSAAAFIHMEDEILHDPYAMTDMERGVARILQALERHERIVIYGDYDVDGVTSVSSLYLYLREHGADVGYYIPNRLGEGYGVNCAALEEIAHRGANLIITVDTGITAHEETVYAKSIGLDMVITDHHTCQSILPQACAVINPHRADCNYPFKELAGVGVVFKLLCALEMRLHGDDPDALKNVCMKYGDLAAIGTIADVMPLVDENRLIVGMGMRLLETTKRCGMISLLRLTGAQQKASGTNDVVKKKKINTSLIGYTIAPRINAAGRISSASKAVELLLSDNEAEADRIANELCNINRERQEQENKIIEDVNLRIAQECDLEKNPVIVLGDESWHHGIVGIVSSRITEHFHLPSILISFDGNIGKGSGRSVKGMNLVNALASCSDLLIKYGGHELAAGLTIARENLPEFSRRMNEYARKCFAQTDRTATIDVDMELREENLSLAQAEELSELEPYGTGNPMPLFLIRDMRINTLTPIGKNKHTKMVLFRNGVSVTALYFGCEASSLPVREGDLADVVFQLDVNEYQNSRTVQMIVRDIAPAASEQEKWDAQERIYHALHTDRGMIGNADPYLPSRDDYTRVYLYIKNSLNRGVETLRLFDIGRHFGPTNDPVAALVKIRIVIDVFRETGILEVEDTDHFGYRFRMRKVTGKIDLERSHTILTLRGKQEDF